MGYRAALLRRWSRRDRLAVLVVAVTVAFLTGTTLLLLAAGTQTAAVAAEFESPGSATFYDDPAAAETAADDDPVLPVATIDVEGSDRQATVVGVPPGLSIPEARPLRAGNGTTLGTIDSPRSERLVGSAGSVTVEVEPRPASESLFAPAWYVTDPATVDSLGPTGAFVIRTGPETLGGEVPLLGALSFFLVGTTQALRTLTAVAAGGAMLVGVTVFSVSRMSVRDRLTAIQVVRATGGGPRTVLGLFTVRALLLTGVGVAVGYAIGVVASSAAVNVAVALGLPTALSVGVTAEAALTLAPLYAAILAVGGLAGALAAWPVCRCAPGEVDSVGRAVGRGGSRLPRVVSPSLLGWRSLVPTTATLTAFVVFVIVLSGIGGAVGPALNTEGTTIQEPGIDQPLNSDVPAVYASALQNRGINASGEVLLLEVREDQPFPARGVEFEAFASVTDVRVVEGRPHRAPHEATIGRDLAQTLDVGVGESLTLGGSTESGLTRVEVVGVFDGEGIMDDHLLVSIPTAQHLAGWNPQSVQIIRTERLPTGVRNESGIEVVSVAPAAKVAANTPVEVRVTVRNLGLDAEQAEVPVQFGEQTRTVRVGLRPAQERTVTVTFETGPPGTYRLSAGDRTTTVSVSPRDALEIRGLPREAPPESDPLVRVVNATGVAVSGATVRVDGRTVTTDAAGRVRVPLEGPGERTVEATLGGESTNRTVLVRRGVGRDPTASLRIDPPTPSVFTAPQGQLRMTNPWNRTLTRTVRLTGPDTTEVRTVDLPPGSERVLQVILPRRPPGNYTVEASSNGTRIARTVYTVSGDERIISALASDARAEASGIGQALEVVLGNLVVAVGTLFGLAALMTVGGTTATFAQAVHARRRTIGVRRATGQSPMGVFGLVLRDAAVVGAGASVLAVVAAQVILLGLSELGFMTVFGVRLSPFLGPRALLGTVIGGLTVTLVGATLATVGLVRTTPAALLTGSGTQESPRRGPSGRPSRADGGDVDE